MWERARSWWRQLAGGAPASPSPLRSQPAMALTASRAEPGKHRRGHAVTPHRNREVAQVLAFIRDWAPSVPAFRAIALTGSWANNTATMASDIDLICLCDDPASLVTDLDWLEPLGYIEEVQPHNWGAFSGLALALESGLVLDWGFGSPAWASTTPINPETRAVIDDGFSIIHDPERLLASLTRACDALTAAEYRHILTERG